MICASEVRLFFTNPSWFLDNKFFLVTNFRSLLCRTVKNSFPMHGSMKYLCNWMGLPCSSFFVYWHYLAIGQSGIIAFLSRIMLKSFRIMFGYCSINLLHISHFIQYIAMPRCITILEY